MKKLFLLIFVFLSKSVFGQETENLILITIDGVRWQEVFGGVDDSMRDKFPYLNKLYKETDKQSKTIELTPFFHTVIAKEGILFGDRTKNELINVKNPHWFSYPGYSEIFTGKVDTSINSNNAFDNPNISFLEEYNQKPNFKNRIAAFGSWDRFRNILNRERSGLYINDGFEDVTGDLNETQKRLNQQQHEFPKIFHGAERLDYFTFYHAFEYLKKEQPRILVIALGDTDEFAHGNSYDLYVNALQQADKWIKQLWEYIQSDLHYKNKTSMIITTDHGRGSIENNEWISHGANIKGADEVWVGIIGPLTKKIKLSNQVFSTQIAEWVKSNLK